MASSLEVKKLVESIGNWENGGSSEAYGHVGGYVDNCAIADCVILFFKFLGKNCVFH